MESYQVVFKSQTPNNQDICDQMKTEFNDTFHKIDGLNQWFEEQLKPASSKREVIVILQRPKLHQFIILKILQGFNLQPQSITKFKLLRHHHTNLHKSHFLKIIITNQLHHKKKYCHQIILMILRPLPKRNMTGDQLSLRTKFRRKNGLILHLMKL